VHTTRAARAAPHRTCRVRRTPYARCPHPPPPSRASCGAACAAAAGRRMAQAGRTEPRSCTEGCRARTDCRVSDRLRRIHPLKARPPSAGGEPALHAFQGGGQGAAVCAVVLQERASLQQVWVSLSAMHSDPQLQLRAEQMRMGGR